MAFGSGTGFRLGVVLVAVAAGMATGALVFKIVGEEQIGSQVQGLTTRLGFPPKAGDSSALDLLERIAPGTQSGFTGAVIGTVVASLLAATAVTIAIREIAS